VAEWEHLYYYRNLAVDVGAMLVSEGWPHTVTMFFPSVQPSSQYKINFPELREALNTKWNVEILEPREGIGRHCLPKDTKMFLVSSKFIRSKILVAAMEIDEDYKRYRAK
jgi:hypothetical protein